MLGSLSVPWCGRACHLSVAFAESLGILLSTGKSFAVIVLPLCHCCCRDHIFIYCKR